MKMSDFIFYGKREGSGAASDFSRHFACQFSIMTIADTDDVQGSTNRRASGLVNFVTALAYLFCLNFPAAFTQPGPRLLVEPCRVRKCGRSRGRLGWIIEQRERARQGVLRTRMPRFESDMTTKTMSHHRLQNITRKTSRKIEEGLKCVNQMNGCVISQLYVCLDLRFWSLWMIFPFFWVYTLCAL